ncbi:hypothetical protein MMC32_008297 [Xylographa parallela]|nr:hypothetical protein [Xylographa parallela]
MEALTNLATQGSTRVWTKAYDGEGAVLVLKKEYEFLSLAHKALTIESIENSTPAQFGYIAPYRFFIPPRVLAPSATVPDQCLYLPPSLLAGQVISGNKEIEKFAQPNVAYYVALKAVFRTSETSEPETREAWEEIKLIPYTEKLPPVETDDFPAEFVHSMTHNFRVSMFSSTMDTMTISLGEPSVIQLGEALCTTDLEFSIDVEATASERSTKRTDRLARCLEIVSFEIEVMLRAKTFYSTVPFPRIPGQTMLTLKGNLGLNDQILKLDTVKVKPARWSYLLKNDAPAHVASNENSFVNSDGFGRLSLENSSTTSATSSTIPPGKWNTTVRLPISVPSSLLPTFCSAIVARQYSLLLRVNASSVNIKSFVLEVPVQIIYPLPDDTDGPETEAFDGTSSSITPKKL